MAADAIEGYLDCLREDNAPIPESDQSLTLMQLEQVKVQLPVG